MPLNTAYFRLMVRFGTATDARKMLTRGARGTAQASGNSKLGFIFTIASARLLFPLACPDGISKTSLFLSHARNSFHSR